jgi:hypothetical protein
VDEKAVNLLEDAFTLLYTFPFKHDKPNNARKEWLRRYDGWILENRPVGDLADEISLQAAHTQKTLDASP